MSAPCYFGHTVPCAVPPHHAANVNFRQFEAARALLSRVRALLYLSEPFYISTLVEYLVHIEKPARNGPRRPRCRAKAVAVDHAEPPPWSSMSSSMRSFKFYCPGLLRHCVAADGDDGPLTRFWCRRRTGWSIELTPTCSWACPTRT